MMKPSAATIDEGAPEGDAEKPDVRRVILKGIRYAIVACVAGIALGVAAWLVIVVPEVQKHEAANPKSAEEIALEKETKAKEAQASATWQTFHCNLLHLYYEGPEAALPLAELVGLEAGAGTDAIAERCGGLLPTVRLLAGWPTGKPQQDNIVVCEGFKFVLQGALRLAIRPTRTDLTNDQVSYGIAGNESHSQDLIAGQPVRLGRYAPIIVPADERCVVVGIERIGRKREIPGRIVRAG